MKKVILLLAAALCLNAASALAAGPLKIGVAAMISPKETVKYYSQMVEYVGAKLGQPVHMVQEENYDKPTPCWRAANCQ